MYHEIRVTKNINGAKAAPLFNVDVILWQRGEGMVSGRSFGIPRDEAEREAAELGKQYNARVEWK